jgi:hypothetical protein
VSKHDGGAPDAAATTAVHPCLCCVFVILLPGVPGRARSAISDGAKSQTDVVNLYIRFQHQKLIKLLHNSCFSLLISQLYKLR